MKSKQSILILFCRVLKRDVATFFRKNWFNILLLSILMHMTLQKDIQFNLSLSSSTIFEESNYVTSEKLIRSKDAQSSKSTFSFGNFLFDSKKSENAEKKSKSRAKFEKLAGSSKSKETSHSSFFSFVFYHDTSGKHPIDPSILNERRKLCNAYLNRFAPVAISEMKKFGIPASIKLAQALLESEAGQQPVTQETNNHFGVQCFTKHCTSNHCTQGTSEPGRYRMYENAWLSFRDHSLLLGSNRYKHLHDLRKTNYQAWAKGLSEAGYSHKINYATELIQLIEYFHLDQWDE